jgi:hypothetical protein
VTASSEAVIRAALIRAALFRAGRRRAVAGIITAYFVTRE